MRTQGKIVARALDNSWDEFESYKEAIDFAKRLTKFCGGWVAIYDQLGLFTII